MLENSSAGPFIKLETQAAVHATAQAADLSPLAEDSHRSPLTAPLPAIAQPLYFLCVNYHSAAFVSDLLHTLEDNQGIVIVNNSPADKSIHRLAASTFGGGAVTIIDAPDNGGFGAGCNLGLQWIYERSPQAIVWVINPDAALFSGAIAQVRQCLKHHSNIAILGTPVLDNQGKLWFASGRFNRWTGSVPSHIRVRSPRNIEQVQPLPTRWITGCSIIFNLAQLKHCPQFDETYFLYYEDCDLCERYFQQGYEIALLPIPLVVHAVSSITSRYVQAKFVYGTISKLIFLRRHATWLALILNLFYLSAKAIAETFRRPLAAKGRWQGIWQFLKNPNPHPYVSALDADKYSSQASSQR